MIQVTIHTPDSDLGTPPEFRDFDGSIEHHEFGTPYAAALHLLAMCSLAELQDLALRQLRSIKQLHVGVAKPHIVGK